MSYDFGQFNMWGPLKKVAVRRPDVAFLSDDRLDAEWQSLNYHSRPDLARAGTAEEYAIFSKMQSVSPFAGFEVQLLYQSSVGKARVRVLLVNTLDEHRIDVVGSSDVTNGANHHIAVGYDGSGTAAGITIHVDGVLDEKIVRSDRLSIHSIENPAVPTIGARDAGAVNLFKGNIQELAIYGGAAQTTDGLARSNVYSAGKPYYR